jgi:hypothetical protein
MKHRQAYIRALKWRLGEYQWSGEDGEYSCPLCASTRGECNYCPADADSDGFCGDILNAAWAHLISGYDWTKPGVIEMLRKKMAKLEATE